MATHVGQQNKEPPLVALCSLCPTCIVLNARYWLINASADATTKISQRQSSEANV
jgi:hypothetical protein